MIHVRKSITNRSFNIYLCYDMYGYHPKVRKNTKFLEQIVSDFGNELRVQGIEQLDLLSKKSLPSLVSLNLAGSKLKSCCQSLREFVNGGGKISNLDLSYSQEIVPFVVKISASQLAPASLLYPRITVSSLILKGALRRPKQSDIEVLFPSLSTSSVSNGGLAGILKGVTALDLSDNSFSGRATSQVINCLCSVSLEDSSFKHLKSLKLDGNIIDFHAGAELSRWLSLPQCRISILSLRSCSLCTNILSKSSESSHRLPLHMIMEAIVRQNTSVTSLDVSGNYCNDQGAIEVALLILLQLPLRRRSHQVNEEVKTVRKMKKCNLKELIMDNIDLSHGNVRLVGQIIANSRIESIGLASCRISDSGILELIAGITVDSEPSNHYFLKKIDLSYNNLTTFTFLKHLLMPSFGFKLESLNLSGNRPCKATFLTACGYIANSLYLQSLDMNNCALDHVCVCVLFGRLSHIWKERVSAEGNCNENVFAGSTYPPIKRISLSNNLAGYLGTLSFARLLKHRRLHPLQEINLRSCHIGDRGAMAILEAVVESDDKMLINVILSQNDLSRETIDAYNAQSLTPLVVGMLPLHFDNKIAFLSVLKCKEGGEYIIPQDLIAIIFSFLQIPIYRKFMMT